MRVVIPAAGLGARLGELTSFLPKPLISVGGKPALSHVIEAYPEDTEFVILVGYKGELIQEFVDLVYPDRAIQCLDVSPFEGVGSGLLQHMFQARHMLQCPFIMHCSDTIVVGTIPAPEMDWSGVYPAQEQLVADYRTVMVVGSTLQHIYDKGVAVGGYIHIGLVGVHDYAGFWAIAEQLLQESFEDTSLSDTHVLNRMQGFHIHAEVFPGWHDTGNTDALRKAIKALGNPDLVMLPKAAQATYVFDTEIVKFFNDPVTVRRRAERGVALYPAVPQITGVTRHFFKYAKAPGALFNQAFPAELPDFLQWCRATLWEPEESFSIETHCDAFYRSKTIFRLSQFYRQTGLEDQPEVINGVSTPGLMALLDRVPWRLLNQGIPTKRFHGDLHFANVLKGVSGYSLIDWREDFGGCVEVGDVYYDLAKLQHGMIIAHDLIDAGQFDIDYANRDNITLDILRRHRTVECQTVFRAFLDEQGYDQRKVDLLTALIFVNICPLHEYPYNFFLYYLGKKMLYDILGEE